MICRCSRQENDTNSHTITDSKSSCAPRVTRISSPSSGCHARPRSDGYAGTSNRLSQAMCSIGATSSSKPKSWSYDNPSADWPALSGCCSHSFVPSISGSIGAADQRVTRRLDSCVLSNARRMFSRYEGRCASCVFHPHATTNGGAQSRCADSTTSRAVRGPPRPS